MKAIAIITGVLMSILGVYAMCIPFRTFLGLGWLLGVMLMVQGVEMVISALSQKKKDVWRCILGVLSVIAGLVLLFSGIQRLLTDVMIAYLVGAFVICFGIYKLINGWQLRRESKGRCAFEMICGVLSVLLGILSVAHPFMTMISVGYVIAFSVLMQGVNMIVLAISAGKTSEK